MTVRKSHPPSSGIRNLRLSIERGHTRGFDKALEDMLASGHGGSWINVACDRIVDMKCEHQLKKILPHAPPDWLQGAIVRCVEARAWRLLPLLLQSVASRPPPGQVIRNPFSRLENATCPWEIVVAIALGRGEWPHPDLWCPSVLKNAKNAKQAARDLFYPGKGASAPGLEYWHLQRLFALDWHPDAPVFMGEALGRMAHDMNILFMIKDLPGADQILTDLILSNKLSVPDAIRAGEGGIFMEDLTKRLTQYVSFVEKHELEKSTPVPSTIRSRVRL